MFPIQFNFPFRKANGDLSTIGAEMSGSSVDQTARNRANDAYALAETANTTANTANTTATNANQQLTGLYDNEMEMGAVNLLPNDDSISKEINGVTFTKNSDGTVDVNGTATADALFGIHTIVDSSQIKDNSLFGKSLKMTGCPSGGSTESYFLRYYRYDVNTNAFDTGDGSEAFVPNATGLTYSNITIYIKSGTVCNHLLFKPMLTLASQPNSDYEHYAPYAKSNKELTDDITQLNKVNTYTMTLESGYYEDQSEVVVYNKICYFAPRFYANTAFSDTTSRLIATLPIGCRPSRKIGFPVVNTSTLAEYGEIIGTLIIDTNGEVTYRPVNINARYFGYSYYVFPIA